MRVPSKQLALFAALLAASAILMPGVVAQDNGNGLPSCDQEMTTCPCNGVRVDKNLIQKDDVLMLRLEGTPVISFPLQIN